MTKHWYRQCPRYQQGRLFMMKYDGRDALLLRCEECEWAYKHPHETTTTENGFLGIDIDCDFANVDAISRGGWQQFTLEQADDEERVCSVRCDTRQSEMPFLPRPAGRPSDDLRTCGEPLMITGFPDEIQRLRSFLLRDVGMATVNTTQSGGFGNMCTTMASENIQVRVSVDRSQWASTWLP
jgi:hypothetical protein